MGYNTSISRERTHFYQAWHEKRSWDTKHKYWGRKTVIRQIYGLQIHKLCVVVFFSSVISHFFSCHLLSTSISKLGEMTAPVCPMSMAIPWILGALYNLTVIITHTKKNTEFLCTHIFLHTDQDGRFLSKYKLSCWLLYANINVSTTKNLKKWYPAHLWHGWYPKRVVLTWPSRLIGHSKSIIYLSTLKEQINSLPWRTSRNGFCHLTLISGAALK